MKLLLSLIFFGQVCYAQDSRIFTKTFNHTDSIIRKTHVVESVWKIIDVKRKLTHVKYRLQKEENLIGITLTYQNKKLMYLTTMFVSSPTFAHQVQNNIDQDKDVTVLLLRETEMIVYNKERKLYTYILIDNDKGILLMCHSLSNPILKKL